MAGRYPYRDKAGGWLTQLHSVDLVFFGGGPNFCDAFLKPFLLGRGVEMPMLVILIGAIGGTVVVWRTKATSSRHLISARATGRL
jgi:hypothetical protein